MTAARHVLISSMKDEGPFILEWVAHHLVTGFDAIYVASNDCSDGSDRLLAALDAAGYIHHVPNVLAPGDIPQHAGYARIRRKHDIDSADWLMMLDADEFLNVHIGSGHVRDLTDWADADVDVIALCGMGFTDAPLLNWQPGRVCAQFTHRLALNHKSNGTIKSLTRGPSRFKTIHNHSMVGWRGDRDLQVMRGDGTRFLVPPNVPLWKCLRHFAPRDITHRLAHFNHYAVKTYDAFMLRGLRGRGAVALGPDALARHTPDYFAARNVADGIDTSIDRYRPAVEALLAEMLAVQKIRRRQRDVETSYAARAAPYRR